MKSGSQNTGIGGHNDSSAENRIHLLLCKNCLLYFEINFFNLISVKEKKNLIKEPQLQFHKIKSSSDDIISLLHEILGRLFFCMDMNFYD